MEALLNYIGLRLPEPITETPEETPPAPAPSRSGLYINDLPGVEAEFLESLSNTETEDASGVWEKIQRRAFARLRVECLLLVNESRNFKNALYALDGFAPVYPIEFPEVAPEDPEVLRGVVFAAPASLYREIRLRAVNFIAREAKSAVRLRIFDLNDGTELNTEADAIVFDASAGFNRIPVDITLASKFGAPVFFVGVSSADLELAKVDSGIYETSSGGVCNRGGFTTSPAKIAINEGGGISGSAIAYDLNDYGLAAELEVYNSLDKYVERNPKPFSEALLYLCGAEMLKEKIASPRQNYFAAGGIAQAETTLTEYERDFKKALRVAMQSVKLEPEAYDVTNKNGYTYGIGYLLD